MFEFIISIARLTRCLYTFKKTEKTHDKGKCKEQNVHRAVTASLSIFRQEGALRSYQKRVSIRLEKDGARLFYFTKFFDKDNFL